MKFISLFKKIPIVLIFAGFVIFSGCQNESTDNSTALALAIANMYKDPLTKVQNETITDEKSLITVNNDTKTLNLSGVKGRTIYMARSNPGTARITENEVRAALLKSKDSSAASQNVQMSELLDVQESQKKTPQQVIYENFIASLKNYTPEESRSLQTRAVKTYSVGDTEEFYALKPETALSSNEFQENVEFTLIISEDKYNVWVKTDDKYYNKYDTESKSDENREKFIADAVKLGKKFINGYGLVSHIYGEVSEYLYTVDKFEKTTKADAMKTYSRTGDKINIMLYELLDKGKLYGFVYQGDFIKGYNGSNEGRFIYMDSQTLVKEPLEAYSAALHEFSHNISFTKKTLENNVSWTYWYGELLAMTCEDMMQAYLGISDDDVDGGLGNTPKARLASANRSAMWLVGLTGNMGETYSSAFMLAAWLSRKFGGVKFVKVLAQNELVDMQSILSAIYEVSGKKYTETSLLQEMSYDMIEESSGTGFNQDAPVYSGNLDYTCAYTDENDSTQTYLYPFTAIDLRAPFYAWCNINFNNTQLAPEIFITNESIPYNQLPKKNVFAKADYASKGVTVPEKAYLGPLMLNEARIITGIGPFGTMFFNLGTANSDEVTITFDCFGSSVKDVITIWVK